MSTSMRSLLVLGLLGSITVMAHGQSPGPETSPTPAQTAAPAPQVPTFSFVDPTVRLLAGSQDGSGEISLRSSKKLDTPPDIKDEKLPHPPAAKVRFESAGEVAPNIWRYRVIVSGLTPASTTQQRYAEIGFGPQETVTIPYLLSNQASGNFSWGISKPPDPWVSSTWQGVGTCTSFSVTPKDSPATGVRISSGLVEQTTKEAITIDNLKVCFANSDCTSTAPIDLPANITSQLKLCITSGFHGDFHGPVTLASLQKPDGEAILQNANFSSFLAKLVGFLLILAGVFLAWVAKVWSRTRLERNQALIPAILMRSQLEGLNRTIETLPLDYRDLPKAIKNAIQQLINELSEASLDQNQFIAPKFPNPFGSTTNAVGYKAYIEERNPRIQLLSVLVNEGLRRVVAEDSGSLTAAQKEFVKTAIDSIDQIAVVSPPPSVDNALTRVNQIIAKLKTDLGAAAPLLQTLTPAAREFDFVQLEIQSISKLIWLVYGLLTALSGLGVLILTDPGFGIPVDFLFTFFWGFGLPTTIQALSPGSVASALNISVSRS